MIFSKIEKVDKKIITFIKCDICNKNVDYEKDWGTIQNFFNINHEFFYGSKRDGKVLEINICEDCFMNMLEEKIDIDSYIGDINEV